MSEGLSPKLPMTLHPSDGYRLNKSYKEMIKQNMKMLILTCPGERMMDPLFGVGLRNFLFDQNTPLTWGNIEGRINIQVKKYMPFVEVIDVKFQSQDENPHYGGNTLSIDLIYKITPLDTIDDLNLALNTETMSSLSSDST